MTICEEGQEGILHWAVWPRQNRKLRTHKKKREMTGAPARHCWNPSSRPGQTVKGSTRKVSLEGNLCGFPTLAGNEVPGGLGRCRWRAQEANSSAWKRAPQNESQLFHCYRTALKGDSVSPKRAPGCTAGTSSRMLFFIITVRKGQDSLTMQTWWRGQSILPPQIPVFSKQPFPTSVTRSQVPAPITPFKYPRPFTTVINVYTYLANLLITICSPSTG